MSKMDVDDEQISQQKQAQDIPVTERCKWLLLQSQNADGMEEKEFLESYKKYFGHEFNGRREFAPYNTLTEVVASLHDVYRYVDSVGQFMISLNHDSAVHCDYIPPTWGFQFPSIENESKEPQLTEMNDVMQKIWTVDVKKDGNLLKTYELTKTMFEHKKSYIRFGRSNSCVEYNMKHPSLSRLHAVIQCHDNGNLYLYDCSTHGTFRNQTRVDRKVYVQIHLGDNLRFGTSSRSYYFKCEENPKFAHDTNTNAKSVKKEKSSTSDSDENGKIKALQQEIQQKDKEIFNLKQSLQKVQDREKLYQTENTTLNEQLQKLQEEKEQTTTTEKKKKSTKKEQQNVKSEKTETTPEKENDNNENDEQTESTHEMSATHDTVAGGEQHVEDDTSSKDESKETSSRPKRKATTRNTRSKNKTTAQKKSTSTKKKDTSVTAASGSKKTNSRKKKRGASVKSAKNEDEDTEMTEQPVEAKEQQKETTTETTTKLTKNDLVINGIDFLVSKAELKKLTNAQLRLYADKFNLPFTTKTKKDVFIEMITTHSEENGFK